MRYIEPDVLAILTREAKATGQICRELYGDDYAMQASKVFYALDSLVRHGWAESRMVTLQNGRRVRYWALPGGTFPKEGPVLLVDRITDALKSGPMSADTLIRTILTDEERADIEKARKRVGKALSRLKRRKLVKLRDDRPSGPPLWELVE